MANDHRVKQDSVRKGLRHLREIYERESRREQVAEASRAWKEASLMLARVERRLVR